MTKYLINWSKHSDLYGWKEVAQEKQKFYYECLGKRKWEIYEPNDLRYLKLKIGYAFFGPPLNLQGKDIERHYKDPNEKKKIDYIMAAIKKVNSSIVLYIGFVYFIATIEHKYTEFPVIRVLKKKDGTKDQYVFIDPLGYTYKSWDKFLNTNVMPSCIYCYPKNGFYTCNDVGDLELGYSYSPQSYSILLKGIGVVSAVGNVVTGVLPGGNSEGKPIIAESAIRGMSKSSKYCWLTVASVDNCSTVYAIHSTYSVAASMFNTDRINNFMAELLVNGPAKINWLSVLNDLPIILQHAKRVNYTHIAQLFVSILFFCHTLVAIDIIRQILKEALYDFSKNTKVNLNYRQIFFFEESRNKFGKEGNHEAVRLLIRIYTKEKLVQEIQDKTSSKNTDKNDNHKMEDLLEVLKVANNRQDIIFNYCLLLEEICKNCHNCYEKIIKVKSYMKMKDEILLNDSELYNETSDFDSSKHQLEEIEYPNTCEHDYQCSLEKIVKARRYLMIEGESSVNNNKTLDETSTSSQLQLETENPNNSEDESYTTFFEEIEYARMYKQFEGKKSITNNEIHDEASDLDNSQYENCQTFENVMLNVEVSMDEKNDDPDDKSHSILQGSTQILCEEIEENLEPLDYYNRFVNKTISSSEPIEFYPHINEKNSWLFVLDKEKHGLKLVKVKVTNADKNLKYIEISYY